jgi:plasmid stabilization system protein ParE
MAEISWSKEALDDLRWVNAYLTREADHRTAARILATIRYKLTLLRDYPHAGPPVEGQPFRSYLIRGTHYVAAYRLVGSRVEILRIHDQRENWRLPDIE